MNKIKEKHLVFVDYNGNKKKFLRKEYFEFICLVIVKLFNEPVPNNEYINNFINDLNTLEENDDVCGAVYFYLHETETHWARSIIIDDWSNESDNQEIMLKLNKLLNDYERKNNITDFIIEG